MNELLMSMEQGSSAGALGPGPQELIGGDMTAGFFGETLASELITGAALYTALAMTGGTVIAANVDAPWLKFAIDGKIVYYAKKAFRSHISRSSMSAAENKTLTIQGLRFAVGLPITKPAGSSAALTTGIDAPYSHGGEWNRLMYPITVATTEHPKASQVGPNWANYQPADVWVAPTSAPGVASWSDALADRRIWRGNDGVSTVGASTVTTASSGYGWRPRLELLP